MFYSQFILAKKGPLGTIWIAAHLERKLRKNQVADTDIGVSVDSILFPEAPIALRLSSHLLLGVVRIYSRKVNYLFDDCSEALLKVKQAFRSAAVDLPPEESTAPYHSITLPETFDLDDFELPDNEIFQGNYVDHHVSTREQITLQDTMDGVVYSTSQFGLDERFGDGDTSQAALDLDEAVFQDKDVVGSEDEGVPGTDHDAYLDAATPEIKNAMVGVSEAMPRDFNEEQVENLLMHNEFIEDAQAPQTPGLVEVPNSTSVREQLACDDHMEGEELNVEEGGKASGELDGNEIHRREEDLSAECNAIESAVTPMEVDKSQIDENVNAQNEPEEERAEHVHISSPCCSHITTEMEDPGQVMTEAGTSVNNNSVADKSDAVPAVDFPERPTMSNPEHCLSQEPKDTGEENQDHLASVTEVNQETDSSLQGDAQASSRPDEQLKNAHITDEQLGNLTGFTDSDLPAPEKVLSIPNGLGDGNHFMVESTPDKEDPGTCNEDATNNNITGKKRTFTESTLTAESLNSVESVGLIQSKRTADSVPDDDDLLSSILVGKASFLKMRSTPVLEIATTKRIRSAPRSTATKRKVLMDDPMVLHGDVIRQQLTNTEGIRRVRKKAPCTIPEIVMLQRQALEDGLLKEPIFTGMSVELVSLHNEPYDLRGIMIIENDNRHASFGVIEDNECSVRDVEENSASQARPNDSEEHPQDQQTINQLEEMKDDNELPEKTSDLEVLKEGNEAVDEVNLVVSDEISQMPSEEKLDYVEDLQVERSHENPDGEAGQDVSAEFNKKSCTDVIEIAEGDIDNNAILNETDFKVEDELPLEDKKTEASAEASEIGIDDQIPCDNTVGSTEIGCVEAGDLSNMALENCNEPLVEENNDGVNPEIESYDKDEPYNEMSNEEVYMQNAVDGEPTSRDGLMGDNDEMDTMEVAHDTGFLNVDDDEVDEDHEDDDDTQYGEETRLLENSGWSSRTRAVAKYLQTLFDKEAENGKNVLVADKLLTGKTRKEASRMFFETLVLKTRDYIQVEQAKPYESIVIKARPKLTKSIF
ncbi:Sister chromatid cohesion 1 protein 4 [Cardamine amara subsp. amara]|uniref:Sister chromatid cohesion 1 protein 4 n=1 Tax=Cardamine amara subsp. amara TaxID=228776 RepID=A0ABD1AGA6_CARAN